MPKLQWQHQDAGGKLSLKVQCDSLPRAARLWVADCNNRDFRKAKWASQPARIVNDIVSGEVEAPAAGFRAFFAELDYEVDGLSYQLSTQLRLAGKESRR